MKDESLLKIIKFTIGETTTAIVHEQEPKYENVGHQTV